MKPAGTIPLPGWLQSQTTQALLGCIPNANETVRFVGGCIRDTLLGLPVKDIDIATLYSPEEMIKFITAKGFKVIALGIEHGSILAIINEQVFEITTLRKDVETFGRYAKIAFTDDWLEDAKRRDFTINALYLAPQGKLYDPWEGQKDLEHGIIKFIGNAERRVQEDYLRILRFFRFLAHFGNEIIDFSSYEACKKFSSSLKLLSTERVHKEFFKLCSAPSPVFALQKMYEAKIFDLLFPTEKIFNKEVMNRLIELEKKYTHLTNLNPLRRFYLLHISSSTEQDFFKFSKVEKNYLKTLKTLFEQNFSTDAILLYRYPKDLILDYRLIEAALTGDNSKIETLITFLETWKRPFFPLKGDDILQFGILAGPQVGIYLSEIEDWWIKKDFLPSHAECLQELYHRLKISYQ